jgi:hypothetical protein
VGVDLRVVPLEARCVACVHSLSGLRHMADDPACIRNADFYVAVVFCPQQRPYGFPIVIDEIQPGIVSSQQFADLGGKSYYELLLRSAKRIVLY